MSHVLVVSTDHSALSPRLLAIRRAGHDATAASSFLDARRVLGRIPPPDLLVTDVRLGTHNGLHLAAVLRVEHPWMSAIAIGSADHVLELEAQALGARYVIAPVAPQELVTLIDEALLTPRPRRRWPRKRPVGAIAARVGGLPARVVDVSYGGMSLEVFGAERVDDPVTVQLPDHGVDVQADRVWVQTSQTTAAPMAIGVALALHDAGWQQFVDAVA